MSRDFLFVVSSHGELGTSGSKTGYWLEELATPYWRMLEAGYNIVIASPKGGAAPLDPTSIEDSFITEAGRRFLADPVARQAMETTLPLSDIDADSLAGVFLVGGAATTWDFPNNPVLKTLVESLYAQSKCVAAICHGSLGLIQAVDRNGEPLIKNRQVTSISNAEDVMMGLDKIVPVLPEEMLRKLRGLYSAGLPLAKHVVCDPPFFTGQNPASADELASEIIAHLARAERPLAVESV